MHYLNGNTKEAANMQIKMNKIYKAVFCDVSPISIKEAMNIMGLNVGACRMPLVNNIQAEFDGDKAKLRWKVSIDGKKWESETYKILAVLDKP